MKAATLREIKLALGDKSEKELIELCLHLSRFKKESKELLTYLLFEEQDETSYINSVKVEMDELFESMNTSSYYYVNKTVRKVLRLTKKYIRYSKKKETEVELLLHFCQSVKELHPSPNHNLALYNIYLRQKAAISKILLSLHEDLQYDYQQELDRLN
ncbi:hypothetical protein N6H18_05440 [Reichenbachiella agarivorans]|uniref:RteC protein n=1 Tax=Reichenbachiella agarivorans TaxID=2979464 RepID=A0ABY6CST0_9BACT|nr:hypothetical protein [Reichenbachiella agarivorans]UXP33394.1 hypothetical protein N6H18_05440 [Reichenbachiella agarivorans]